MRMVFTQNMDAAIGVMREAGQWLLDSGKEPSKWWDPRNLNTDFLLQHAGAEEFYVGEVDGVPAVAALLQTTQDSGADQPAMYIHWLCVSRAFAGQGLPQKMVEFAAEQAKAEGIHILRLDTDASKYKLRSLYEALGFELVSVKDEGYRSTAFYEMNIMQHGNVEIKKSGIGQFNDGLGVFALRDFTKGEQVMKYNLQTLTEDEYDQLPAAEKHFTHKRHNVIYYYPDPERHVNRHTDPNVYPDFEQDANIALRGIKKGEELSIEKDIKEDF